MTDARGPEKVHAAPFIIYLVKQIFRIWTIEQLLTIRRFETTFNRLNVGHRDLMFLTVRRFIQYKIAWINSL